MTYEHIASDNELVQYCDRMKNAAIVGFDTEFVSEDTFQPRLCLVQVAVDGVFAVIDALEIQDMRPFWQWLVRPNQVTVVHAGREELRFCMREIEQLPQKLFDIQIAAALVGLEYPAAYGTLIQKLLGASLQKGETRTDWRKRPLSTGQLDYAAQDVIYLQPLYDELTGRLEHLDRLDWLWTEMTSWQNQVMAHEQRENWRRISGISGLSHRSLAVVRELWRWRQKEAQRRDVPVKRVLRDDLIVELARRQTAEIKRIQALRGMQRGDIRKHVPRLADAIQLALQLPDDQLPNSAGKPALKQLTMIGQFLHTALNSICRTERLAPGIVATAQDVRDFIAHSLDLDQAPKEPPSLSQGWRAEIAGKRLDDLLAGRTTIRVRNALANDPLVFENDDTAGADGN